MKINYEKGGIRLACIAQWLAISFGIYYFSSQSSISFLPPKVWDYDKLVHFFVFLIYGISTYILIRGLAKGRGNEWSFLASTLIIGTIFGAFDEFHQSFTPGRDSNIFDFLADFTGVLVSVILIRLLIYFYNKK